MATGRVPSTANSPLTAKGDLFGYSTAPARLAVGNDGEQIVADSSASTGLRYNANFAAGKNKIINGDFGIWQRGTSFTAAADYTADRWVGGSDATITFSRQAFTPGTAPVAGYEGSFFIRQAKSAGGGFTDIRQRIEDVRTFAGQTVTLSFWAKVASGTASIEPYYVQNFGSGGSGGVAAAVTAQTINTSWARYSFTFTLPSISGKTIGTSNFLEIYATRCVTSSAVTIDTWGVQLEAGSVATAFQTATGTIQGELAACQRYYQRFTGNTYTNFGIANAPSTTAGSTNVPLLSAMRVTPTAIDYGGTIRLTDQVSNFSVSAITLISVESSPQKLQVTATSSSLTQFRMYFLSANNDAAAYLGVSAEL
jgi:hypothetical protein